MKVLLCVDDDAVLGAVLSALEWALALSSWDEVTLLHVLPSQPLFVVGRGASPTKPADAFVERVLSELDHFPSSLEVARAQGEPAEEIVRVAEAREVDLILMGARGERRDFPMGSVSQKVVSLADTDVLVVRHPERGGTPDGRSGFRALVAVDGSRDAEAGIDSFARKTRADGAAIRLVHVVESIPSLWQLGMEEAPFKRAFTEHAHGVLSRARAVLKRHGLDAECEWRRGSAAEEILDVARANRSDLIVVGSRGHSGLKRIVLGSISQRILRHAPCTVLCAKAWAPESRAVSKHWASDDWEPRVGMA